MSDPSELDDREFRLLDSYVERLRNGGADRNDIVGQNPDLAPALDCLDALEGLAAPLALGLPDEAGTDSDRLPEEHLADAGSSASVRTLAFEGLPPLGAPSAPTSPAGQPGAADSVAGSGPGRAIPDSITDFGEFELLDEIGRGGMGIVFRARQKSLDRIVAVKMILAGHLVSEEQVRRLRSEAKVAAGVSHPHVVRIFEVGELRGQHYFVMEYVAGESLAQRLTRDSLDEDTAVRCVAAVARAVEHLHRHGIVHCDLKPSNILLDESGRPYVTDFGLARIFAGGARASLQGLIAGTPSYMAPEQAAGGAEVGPASDVYSLGAILYELLTRRPPFREPTPLDTLVQVLERPPAWPRQFNPRVSRELEMICLKCLEKSPAERYSSAAALADDLERFLAGQDLEARPPRGWRIRRWVRRQPALALRLAALAGFYAVETVNYYHFHEVDAAFHRSMSLIVAAWVLVSIGFQKLLGSPRCAPWCKFAWAAADAGLLSLVALNASGVASPIVIGFPVLIVLSGLWFQVRLVWFTTAASMAAYLALTADFYLVRTELQQQFDPSLARHIYFEVALAVLGAVVAWQVARIRALGRYYQKWRFE